MKENYRANILFCNAILLVLLSCLQGCAVKHEAGQVHSGDLPDFVRVVAGSGDTLPLLASRYLDDPQKSWVIAEFNDVTDIHAGQELIIPLEPFNKGALSLQGYQTVPVLCYHNFSENKKNLMMVTRHDFEQQMKFLSNNGYTVISLDEFFDFLDYKVALPEKAVVITIDDGWQGVYTIAYPVLQRYGFPATLFVYTDLINGNRKTLNWQQVAELENGGIDIQCHTKTHRNLNKIKDDESFQRYVGQLEEEITASTRIIKEKIGKEVTYLAYPYGAANNIVVAYLQKKGYRGAFTVKRGSNPFFENRFSLHRRMIYGDFDLQDFKRNLKIYSSKAIR